MARVPVSKPQRVFFALWPDAAARTMLAALAHEIAAKYGGRPTAAPLIHLTLAFLGDQPAVRIGVLRHLASGIQALPFVLALDAVGTFRRAGVVWLGASALQPGLVALHAQLVAALRAEGFSVDARPYAPHLTLARHGATEIDDRLPQPIRWQVSSFALVESELGRHGSVYQTLAEWPLAAA